MRIIAGRFRGRALAVPATDLRPSSDRLREGVFNVLAHASFAPVLEGAAVLDVFAGTGAYGLEALSRGAARATFIDRDGVALAAIRRNAASFGVVDAITLLRLDATRLIKPPGAAGVPALIAYLDPPYGSGLAGEALAALALRGWLADGAVAVAEVAAREPLVPPPPFAVLDERIYGAGRAVFLGRAAS